MANIFLADPVVLRAEGNKLLDQSERFDTLVLQVYSTINDLVSKGYVSQAARAIASDIEKCHGDLNNMTKTIADYGRYCLMASSTVSQNEQNIIDNYTGNGTV